MDESRRFLFVIFSGAFGLVVGSFLNVVIFRLPRNCMSISAGRSKCPSCRTLIAWYDNVPVASWLVLGGKCRTCGVRISPRYALVELLTGALFLGAGYLQLWRPTLDEPVERVTQFVIHAYLIAAIVASTFIDIDWEILPDEINRSGLALGLVAGAGLPAVLFGEVPRTIAWLGWLPDALRPHAWGLVQSVLGAAAGGGSMYAVGVLGTILFRKRVQRLKLDTAMGFGDVKYLAFLGAFLGWQGMGLTFLVSIFVGAAWGVGKALVTLRFDRALLERPERMGFGPVSWAMGKVPFGPFLSVGALAVLFAKPWLVRAIQAYLDLFRGPRG
jgi:leader peptidase (prepilin peptidase)/N-methyltransferase